MNILIPCEFSGILRNAFIDAGHNAISCDLIPSELPGPHILGDVRPVLRYRWDLVIAFPPCTYLSNAGVQYLHKFEGRWEKMYKAAAFFRECLNANAPRVAVENPIMHGYGLRAIDEKYSFWIQPFNFGEPVSKRTCFWVRNLPPLLATEAGDTSDIHAWHTKTSKIKGEKRRQERSRIFPKIAKAIVSQWGSLDAL